MQKHSLSKPTHLHVNQDYYEAPNITLEEKNISKSLWKILGGRKVKFFLSCGHNDMVLRLEICIKILRFIEYLKWVMFAKHFAPETFKYEVKAHNSRIHLPQNDDFFTV